MYEMRGLAQSRLWKCGRCGVTYTTEEYMELDRIACGCGYVFHKDRWHLVTLGVLIHHMTAFHWLFNKLSQGRYCKPHEISIRFSTVFLELNHGWAPGKPLWYETMVFPELEKVGRINCGYQARYETKEQAEKGHEMILSLFEKGSWTIKYYLPTDGRDLEWRLDFSERARLGIRRGK